jgi:hypothetical protein
VRKLIITIDEEIRGLSCHGFSHEFALGEAMTKETFQHSKKAKRQNGLTWPFQMPFPYSDTEIEMFDDV